VIGIAGLVHYEFIFYTFSHYSRLATASTVLALLYLYCSDYTKIDRMIFLLILALGLLSTRSKHFGFFAFCALSVMYFRQSVKIELNVKNTFFLLTALALTIYVAWDKIYYYFITGGYGDGRAPTDLYARMALYYFSGFILLDFIPFGSGFASYATFASGASYSPIYVKYGMQNMHGLSKANPDFIADTYYPALAQFGFVGVILFFYFWFHLAKQAIKVYSNGFRKEAIIAIMIIVFFLIECTSDATITHNRGMFIMMLLGVVFADTREIECKI
jgi:hypothetical protein